MALSERLKEGQTIKRVTGVAGGGRRNGLREHENFICRDLP